MRRRNTIEHVVRRGTLALVRTRTSRDRVGADGPSRSNEEEWVPACELWEAAAIGALADLRVELAKHGAPVDLLWTVEQVQADDEDYARPCPEGGPRRREHGAQSVRPLEEILTENEVEGIVHGGYVAAVLLWQARNAADPSVRRAVTLVADQDCKHTELSVRIRAWGLPRLLPEQKGRLVQARQRAVEEVEREWCVDEPRAGNVSLWLPPLTIRQALIKAVAEELWEEEV